MYYNEDIKNAYIDTIREEHKNNPRSNKLTSAIGIYKRTSEYEEKLGKDIYEMTTQEIVDMIISFRLSKNTALNYRIMLHKYIEWCIENGYTKVDTLDKNLLTLEEFKSYLDSYERDVYITPEMYDTAIHFLKKELLNFDYDGTIFMGIYEGLTFEELSLIRRSDIDRRNNLIKLDRGFIKVSKDFIDRLYITGGVDILETNGRPRYLKWSKDLDSVFLFPKAMTPEDCARNLQRRFNPIRKMVSDELELDAVINIADLANSGLLNYIISRCNDFGIDFIQDLKNPRYQYKYNVDELNHYYKKILVEKCLPYEIRHLRTKFSFMIN